MPTPCSPAPHPVRSLINRAGMICRQLSLAYEDADPARMALLQAAREIEALEIPSSTRPEALMPTKLMTKVEGLRDLPKNWNSYGASPISDKTVDAAKRVAAMLTDAWTMVPTNGETIQFGFPADDFTIEVHAMDETDLQAVPFAESAMPITHVICFEGEGAEVLLCRGWHDCREQFFNGIFGDGHHDWDEEQVRAWDAELADADKWSNDESGKRYRFTSDIGEISKVRIYEINGGS